LAAAVPKPHLFEARVLAQSREEVMTLGEEGEK